MKKKHSLFSVMLQSALLLVLAAAAVYVLQLRGLQLLPVKVTDAPAAAVSAAPAELSPEPSAEPSITSTAVVLSELMPKNDGTLFTEACTTPDWLELVNSGSTAETLTGFTLSAKGENGSYTFPETVLQPGERLLVYCCGKNAAEGEAPFKLSDKGGSISLAAPEGNVLWSVSYPAAGKDISIVTDGAEPVLSEEPTPGYENSAAGRASFLRANETDSPLVINEAVLYNGSYAEQQGEYYDWVELKNVSAETINLSSYTLSDKADPEKAYPLPDKDLEPGAVYVVLCSGDESLTNIYYYHMPFSLSSGGETLWLRDAAGEVADRMHIAGTTPTGSMGRMEGSDGFFYFGTPTPGAANGTGYRSIVSQPVAEPAQGVYEDTGSLTVTLSGEGTIRYTTDGTVPTEESELYTGPLTIDSTTILRAASFTEDKLTGMPATFSYFLNEGSTLSIVSLVSDPANITGSQGIYRQTGWDFSVDANIAFFGEEGSFGRDCSVKLHGASSRNLWAKKSFKLIFNGRFGGDLEYDIFGTGEDASFHSINLRGGDSSGMHMVRDELSSLVTKAVSDKSYALNSRYCRLYINGEYWGLYAIREAYSEEFYCAETGSDPATLVTSRAPAKFGELFELFEYIKQGRLDDPERWAYVDERLDMESFAAWIAIESYFNNMDVAGNIRYFRADGTGNKWVAAVFDFDRSMTNKTAGLYNAIMPETQMGHVCYMLLQSENFKEIFLRVTSELMEKGLNDAYVLEVYDSLIAQLTDDEVSKDCERWRESFDTWKYNEETQRACFSKQRTIDFLNSIQYNLKLSDEQMQQWFGDYKAEA